MRLKCCMSDVEYQNYLTNQDIERDLRNAWKVRTLVSEELIRLDELGATREDLVAGDRRVWQVNICQADEDSARDELH